MMMNKSSSEIIHSPLGVGPPELFVYAWRAQIRRILRHHESMPRNPHTVERSQALIGLAYDLFLRLLIPDDAADTQTHELVHFVRIVVKVGEKLVAP